MQVRAYVRVSTDEQAQEGFSIPTQKQRILDYCRAVFDSPPDIVWYADEGFSAKNMLRPAIARLRAEAKPQDVVLVLRLDRLTRSVADLYTLLADWNRQGVALRSVTESFNTDTPEGRFMVTLLASLAQWERERNAERVREVMANIVRDDRRHISRAPYGYDLREKRLEVNEQEALVVREIFRRCLQGRGTRAIALELNKQGVRTKSGAEWTDFTVAYVLRNPVYTGRVTWGRTALPGVHRPIIDEGTWAAAEAAIRERKKRPARAAATPHPLTGIAWCGLCGGALHGFIQHRYKNGRMLAGRERRYYRCSNRNHKASCSLPYLPAEALEARVLRKLPPLGNTARLIEVAKALLAGSTTDGPSVRMAALTAELKRLEQRRRRWDSAFSDGDLARADWLSRIAEIEERAQAIRQSCAALAAAARARVDPAEVADALGNLPRHFGLLRAEERKAVLQGLLERVEARPDGQIEITLRRFGSQSAQSGPAFDSVNRTGLSP